MVRSLLCRKHLLTFWLFLSGFLSLCGGCGATWRRREGVGVDDCRGRLKKKKKKKKKERRFQDDDDLAVGPSSENTAPDSGQSKGQYAWSGTTRDYTYDELIDRAYSILREKNPELTGVIKKISLKPPNVSREGTKKTVLMNFAELCKSFNRQVDQVMPFITADMGTTGSLDGQNRLIMKGKFQSHNFAIVLRRYINEYVMCPSCKSFDTLLDKDSATRLMYLRCQQCGASKSVQAIRSGFLAQVGRRPKK